RPSKSREGRGCSSQSAAPTRNRSRRSRHFAVARAAEFTAKDADSLASDDPSSGAPSMPLLWRANVARLSLTLACFCIIFGSHRTAQAQQAPAFARELPSVRTSEPALEFNGKDLTGFYTYLHDSKYDDPKGVFSVKDGVLVISGEEFGGLTT